MYLLFNGCSFTQGDELPDPEQQRFSTHIAKLSGIEAVNIAADGSSNSKIYRNTLDYILNAEEHPELVYVQWSDFARFELLTYNAAAFFNRAGEFVADDPFVQVSPARLQGNYRPIANKEKDWLNFYDTLYIVDHGILETLRYMSHLRLLCNKLNIKLVQSWFHPAMRRRVLKSFVKSRKENLGERLELTIKYFNKYFSTLQDSDKLGQGEDYSEYITFDEFVETYNLDRMPKGHPGIESHKLFAEYTFNIFKKMELL